MWLGKGQKAKGAGCRVRGAGYTHCKRYAIINISLLPLCRWCHDQNKTQSTDIHFRSFAGEGIFNWRMIYHLAYSPNEDMVSTREEGRGVH